MNHFKRFFCPAHIKHQGQIYGANVSGLREIAFAAIHQYVYHGMHLRRKLDVAVDESDPNKKHMLYKLAADYEYFYM